MSTRDPRDAVEGLRERIRERERDVTDEDAEALLTFSNQLDLMKSEYSDYRHLKLLRHCTRMAEATDQLADAAHDRDAAEAVVRWINREYDNEETNRDYRSAIRVFAKRVRRLDESPESVAWIPTGTSSSYDPTPSERDLLLFEEDVKPMIDACRNTRDAACIMLQFEAGLRGGELQSLTVGDIVDSEHALAVHADGKEGERVVHLVVSVPYLNKWLNDHPAGDDPDAPLWSHLSKAEAQSYTSYLSNFKEPAKRIDLSKDVTPTNFRRSNTRWLVLQGMSQSRIEDRQGRKRGSEATQRYMARFGEESNERAYASMHGLDVEEDPDGDDHAPLTCPRCDRETPRDNEYCVWCHQALSPEAAERVEAVDEAMFESGVETDDPEVAEDLRTVNRRITAPVKHLMANDE